SYHWMLDEATLVRDDQGKPIEIVIKEKPWGTHYQLKAYPIDARDQFRFSSDLTIRAKEVLLDLDVEFTTVTQAVAE
ncbi:MAG: hypothetical protein ACFFDT_25840, partial [Candidatus Hodarchaeota archaeon]